MNVLKYIEPPNIQRMELTKAQRNVKSIRG
jgi:hypothetical protein